MKMIKRLLTAALIAALILTAQVFAEESEASVRLEIQDVIVDDQGNAEILFYTDASSVDSIGVSLDGTPTSITDLVSYERGTTWLFLVDTASVSTRSGPEPIRATLDGLIDMVGEGDNAAILSTGVDSIELVENASTLRAMVDSLKMDTEQNQLSETIAFALEFLAESDEVREHAVLVVLSGGETTTNEGKSASEMISLARSSNATIYAVAYRNSSTDGNAMANYMMLSVFSKGGYPLPVDSGKEAVDQILESVYLNEQRFYLLGCTPAANGANGSVLSLEFNGAEDSYELSPEDQEKIQHVIDANQSKVEEEIVIPSVILPVPQPLKKESDWLLYVAIGGCALALIVVIALIALLFRRKKPRNNRPETSPVSVTYPINAAGGPPSTPGGQPQQPNREPEVQVMLTALGGGPNRFASFRGGELIVGRDPARAKLLLEDPKVSGAHLKLWYQNGSLVAEDVSRNGTEVNGQRISAPTLLRQRDVLTMGLSQYQITWWAK